MKSSRVQIVHMHKLLYCSHVIDQETEVQSQRSHSSKVAEQGVRPAGVWLLSHALYTRATLILGQVSALLRVLPALPALAVSLSPWGFPCYPSSQPLQVTSNQWPALTLVQIPQFTAGPLALFKLPSITLTHIPCLPPFKLWPAWPNDPLPVSGLNCLPCSFLIFASSMIRSWLSVWALKPISISCPVAWSIWDPKLTHHWTSFCPLSSSPLGWPLFLLTSHLMSGLISDSFTSHPPRWLIPWTRVSPRWPFRHLGLDSSLWWGTSLCIVGYLAAHLLSTL